ncbi:hypothetical protein QR680_016243 [Steinernema hermaphroditum]|uniref:Carboxypeptidase n=1 Tax=Steinernema hermaphroditum TaxID=289476 RepID=A0AA39LM45_9BILA|nr:hypothetical protein QR680_016243 [Steinernema hermaphroditum]
MPVLPLKPDEKQCGVHMPFLFFLCPDGKTLFENVYSWNKGYNMIFLEGPRGVGFSYQEPNVSIDTTYNDNLSAIDYYNALLDFFTVYPELLDRDFYVTGESYGGVYVPTLIQHILKEQNLSLPSFANFKGFVVGNGLMSSIQNVRSLPDYMYFHGMVGSEEWNQLAGCCKNPDGLSKADCHYDDFVTIPRFGTFIPKHNASDPNVEKCGKIIENIASKLVWDGAGDLRIFFVPYEYNGIVDFDSEINDNCREKLDLGWGCGTCLASPKIVVT